MIFSENGIDKLTVFLHFIKPVLLNTLLSIYFSYYNSNKRGKREGTVDQIKK